MGGCLICLFYWGTVLNIYLRIPDGGLASLFWASSSNTPSSVYRGLLGDYCSAVISPTLWSEEHQGTSSGAGIGCCLCQDVHDQDSAPQLEVSFVSVLLRTDRLVLFSTIVRRLARSVSD